MSTAGRTTTAQHVAFYELMTRKAAAFREVEQALRDGGDTDLADRLEIYAAGFDGRAEHALRDAVAALDST